MSGTLESEAFPREKVVFADGNAVAAEGARRFAAAAARAIAARGRFTVALSGGSTPKGMYRLLAQSPYRDSIDWPRVTFYFGDERTVPPEHPDSNYRMAREALLEHVPATVYRIAGERPPKDAAAAYEVELLRLGQSNKGNRQDLVVTTDGSFPRLDLVLLGMGPDGHTASLFPHTTALEEHHRLVIENYVEKLGTWRITMTVPLLNAAREILFLVAGAEKRPVLHTIATTLPDPHEHPVLLIHPTDGTLTWLLDRAAAGE